MRAQRSVGIWRLSGVEANAFSRGSRPSWYARLSLRAGMLLALLVFEKRAHGSGCAVCLLGARRLRIACAVALLVVAVMALGALAPWVAAGALCIVAIMFGEQALGALRSLPAQCRLRRGRPPRPYRYVHSLASTRQGAGAELLVALEAEADDKGWWLVTEASNEKLAHYYEGLGFARLGPSVVMHDGSPHVRMGRPPLKEG